MVQSHLEKELATIPYLVLSPNVLRKYIIQCVDIFAETSA